MTRLRTHTFVLVAVAAVAWPGVLQGQAVARSERPDTIDSTTAAPSRIEQLVQDLARAEARVMEVEENFANAGPTEREVFDFQRRRRWLEHHEVLLRLAREIERSPEAAPDSVTVAHAAEALGRELETIATWTDEVNARISLRRRELASASAEQLVEEEIALTALYSDFVRLLEALTDDLEIAPTFGMDLAEELAAHDRVLVDYGELTGAALELAVERVGELRSWLGKPGVDTVSVKLRIAAGEERIRGITVSLEGIVRLLDRRDFPTADYQALIVSATGQLGTQVLDTQVLGGLFARWGRALTAWAGENVGTLAVRAIAVLLVLLLAGRVARIVRSVMKRALRHAHLSSLIQNLLVNATSTATWLFAFLVVLSIVGIDLAPMLAGLGIAGFVVGFALQDTLANFASGLMIMIYRPFDVGDFVTAGGVTGEVKHLTLVSTVIRTMDNQRIIVPNGKVWGDVINNATAEQIRRVDLVFGIDYGDDIDRARAVLEDILAGEERVLSEPEPVVRVGNLGESSVDLLCRPWCRTEDYWELKWHLTAEVKRRFDAERITIPFPQRTLHVSSDVALREE